MLSVTLPRNAARHGLDPAHGRLLPVLRRAAGVACAGARAESEDARGEGDASAFQAGQGEEAEGGE